MMTVIGQMITWNCARKAAKVNLPSIFCQRRSNGRPKQNRKERKISKRRSKRGGDAEMKETQPYFLRQLGSRASAMKEC